MHHQDRVSLVFLRGHLRLPLVLTAEGLVVASVISQGQAFFFISSNKAAISLVLFPVVAGTAYDSASLGVLTDNLLCVPVCVAVFSVCVTLFFIPGSDSIRIPYGTKLFLYMSKDAEGTEEFSHNSSSVFAHDAAPLTHTCSKITLSAPRRHVDLNVGWMLSEHYVFPILPPPLLSVLTN